MDLFICAPELVFTAKSSKLQLNTTQPDYMVFTYNLLYTKARINSNSILNYGFNNIDFHVAMLS